MAWSGDEPRRERPVRHPSKGTDGVIILFEGRKLEPGARRPPAGEFTYTRLKGEPAARPKGEQRALCRLRTRLRSGKVFDNACRSLVDCLIHDRSVAGARLRLMADRPIPTRFRLVDEASGIMTEAELIWRRGREVGVRLRVPCR